MAVKKSTAPKAGAAKTAKAPKVAAKAKAAPKAKAPKVAAKVKAAPKAKAPKATAAKKAAPKKAAIKLTDPQKKLLEEVAAKGEAGLTSTKSNTKQLTALQGKKLVKKGKKTPEGILFHITKLGAKHAAPAPASEGSSASA